MNKRLNWWVGAVVLLAAVSAAAQGFWDKKEWKKWSAGDCKKMSTDSPWAQRWVQSVVQTAQFSSYNRSTGEGTGGGGAQDESRLEVWYIVQLRSSQPIREAFVRDLQIQNKYDKMDEKARASLDQQTDPFLARKYDDTVIVHVYYGSNVPAYDRELATFWQTTYPSGVIPQEAFLNTASGKKVTPLRLNAPKGGGNEFELIFPRVVDGEPVATGTSKTLSVEFHSPKIQNVPEGRVFIEFKPDKMQYHGTLSY